MKKGFTLIELIITIAIIAIISAVLIPTLANNYNKSKDEIITIVNNETLIVVKRGDEIIEQGKDVDLSKYTIKDIKYEGSTIIVYVE